MAGSFFAVSSSNADCRSYPTYKSQFQNLNGRVLFHIFDNSLDAVTYFASYKPPLLMGTSPVLTTLAIHHYEEVDCRQVAVRDRFFRTTSKMVKSSF